MYSRILRLKEVMSRTGLSRSTIYSMMAKGQFPKQIVLSERCVGWKEDDIQDWILSRLEEARKIKI